MYVYCQAVFFSFKYFSFSCSFGGIFILVLQVRSQALPLRARVSLAKWYVPIKIANATQFVVRRVA